MPSRSSSQKRRAPFRSATGAGLSGILRQRHSGSGSVKFCSIVTMKKLILNNWRAKLTSLLLATALWYLIKKNVATTPSRSEFNDRPAAEELRQERGVELNAKSARDFRLPTDGPDDTAGKLVRGDKIPRCECDDDRLNSFRREPLSAASRDRAHTRETTAGRRADRAA